MLMLVLGQNFLVLYLGWEGVGLCSYLLIGFWFEKSEDANAAKKAFIVTRIGDAAMLIGIVLIAVKFGSLDFTVVFGAAGSTLHEERRHRDRAAAAGRRGREVRAAAAARLAARTPWRARRRCPR